MTYVRCDLRTFVVFTWLPDCAFSLLYISPNVFWLPVQSGNPVHCWPILENDKEHMSKSTGSKILGYMSKCNEFLSSCIVLKFVAGFDRRCEFDGRLSRCYKHFVLGCLIMTGLFTQIRSSLLLHPSPVSLYKRTTQGPFIGWVMALCARWVRLSGWQERPGWRMIPELFQSWHQLTNWL